MVVPLSATETPPDQTSHTVLHHTPDCLLSSSPGRSVEDEETMPEEEMPALRQMVPTAAIQKGLARSQPIWQHIRSRMSKRD